MSAKDQKTQDSGKGNGNNGGSNPGNGGGNPGHGGGNPGTGGGNDKKVNLTVIVSGTPTEVDANPNQKLHVVAQKALEQTGNTARPLSEWTLKTRDGVVLNMNNTVESYELKDGDVLVLSLDAGVGGCNVWRV
jgi:hypothetical protein